jgi:hypothetical protein
VNPLFDARLEAIGGAVGSGDEVVGLEDELGVFVVAVAMRDAEIRVIERMSKVAKDAPSIPLNHNLAQQSFASSSQRPMVVLVTRKAAQTSLML